MYVDNARKNQNPEPEHTLRPSIKSDRLHALALHICVTSLSQFAFGVRVLHCFSLCPSPSSPPSGELKPTETDWLTDWADRISGSERASLRAWQRTQTWPRRKAVPGKFAKCRRAEESDARDRGGQRTKRVHQLNQVRPLSCVPGRSKVVQYMPPICRNALLVTNTMCEIHPLQMNRAVKCFAESSLFRYSKIPPWRRREDVVEDFDFRQGTTTWGHSRQIGQIGGRNLASQTTRVFFSWHLAYFTRLKIPRGQT